MTGTVISNRLGTGGSAFGPGWFPLFTFALLLYCALLLVGCNSQTTNVAKVDQVQSIPAEAKKADLLKSLDRKYENPDAHFELGQLYQAEGLWSKAEWHYNIAINFDPAHRPAQAAMVRLFLDSGDTARAKNYADTYMNQVAGSATQSLLLALAFQKQQLDQHALACYQQALNLEPNSAKINKQLGYYYLSKNDKVQAKQYLVRSFQLDPRQPEVAGELGRLGVEVRIPQKTEKDTKKPDKMDKQSGEESERKSIILMKHGLIQVEQLAKESEEK